MIDNHSWWGMLFCDMVEHVVENRTLHMNMRMVCEQVQMGLVDHVEVNAFDAKSLSTKDLAILDQFLLMWQLQSETNVSELIAIVAFTLKIDITHLITKYREVLTGDHLEYVQQSGNTAINLKQLQ